MTLSTGRPAAAAFAPYRFGYYLLAVAAAATLVPDGRTALRIFELLSFAGCWLQGRRVAGAAVQDWRLAALTLAVLAVPAASWGFRGVPDTERAAEALLGLAAAAAYFWTARAWLVTGCRRDWLLDRFAVFGTSLVVLAALQYLTAPERVLWLWPARYPDVLGPFENRNHFSSYAALVAPLAAARLGAWPAAAAVAAGLVSGSRAGSALVGAAALLAAGFARGRRARFGLAFGAAGCVAAALAGDVLMKRWSAPDPLSGRRELASAAWEMARSAPWTGHGIGSFPEVYREYRTADTGEEVGHAHCDWLEAAADSGLAGLLPAAGWAGSVARAALVSGWGSGVALVAAHGLVDYPLRRANVAVAALLVAAAAVAARRTPAGANPAPDRGGGKAHRITE
jgi:O-antigen ligase